MDVQVSTLASGLRVATDHVPGAWSVAIGVWVGVGSRDEPSADAGVSHVLEHLLFKGTPRRNASDIAVAFDRVGGDSNAVTSREYTAFYCRLPVAAAEVGYEILADIVTEPRLDPVEMESERQVILEELAADEDVPEDVVHRLANELLFPGHPLGRDVGGTAESVTGLGVDTVRLFHDRWYRPPNMVIAVAGPVDHAQVVDAVSRRTVGRPGAAEPVRRDPPGAAGPVFRREDRDSEQSHLVVGVRAFERTHPDREALDVVNHVLGGGMSSRLFQQIREERGLAYAVHSGTWFMQDSGALSVYAGTMPEHVPTVLGLIDAEMDRIAADGVTDEELEVAIGCLTGSFVLGLEDTGSRMWRVGSHLSTVGEVRTIEDQVARWREVTGEQVRRVAASVLGGPRVVTVVGDAGVR